MSKTQTQRIIDQQYATRAVRNASGNATYTVINVVNHSALNGLSADDHTQYLLATDAGGRTAFAVKWLDLTDGLDTTLHIHDSRYFTKTELQNTGTAAIHWSNISKVGSNLNEIQTRSHTVLTDIGTNTHANIDTHIATADVHVAHSAVSIVAGDGLTGGGTITADRTIHVGVSGLGLSVGANAVTLTSSSIPGAAASILATDAAGAITLVDLTISSLTASRLVASNGTDKLVSANLNSWIAGTTNRVTVADDGDGSVTLSAPQDIHTAATPTFGGLTIPWLRPATDSTTAIRFQTLGGTTVATVDTTNQRFGVGTTPSYKFQAQVSTNGNVASFNSTGSGDNHAFVIAINDLSGTPFDNFVVLHSTGSNSGGFIFAGGNTERMRLTYDGKLGIGLDPTYKLDVSGDIRLSGTLFVDTTSIVDFGTDYFQEGATYLELKGTKPFYFNQTIQSSGWSISTGGALVSNSSLSAASLALTGAATITGDLTVGGTVLQVSAAGTRVGINRAADQQFDLDVAGAIRGQYLVGPHALQLSDAKAIVHFDGPAPYNLDFSGTSNTHMGENAIETGGVIYRPGKFGKAVQVAEATTNLILNPSFETNTTGWGNYSGVTISQNTTEGYYGSSSLNCLCSAGSVRRVFYKATGLTTGATYTISVWMRRVSGAGQPYLYYKTLVGTTESGTSGSTAGVANNEWQRITATITLSGSDNGIMLNPGLSSSADGDVYLVDAVQLEQKAYATPYCDGSLGQGHSWSGTAHASTSSRTVSTLTYPNVRLTPSGTVMMWINTSVLQSQFSDYRWLADIGGSTGFILYQLYSDVLAIYQGSAYRAGYLLTDANFAPNTWHHVGATWNAATSTCDLYFDGILVASGAIGTPTDDETGMQVGGGGIYYPFPGLIDDLVLLDYAADAKLIRSIYESNAPVFAESSVVSFRAPSKSQIWVDEFGLWAKGVSGGEVFGLYGGDPRTPGQTKSWGGITMEENDVVIGRTSAPSYTALHWDDNAGQLILGRQAAEHIVFSSSGIQIKNNTTPYITLSGGNATFIGSITAASGTVGGWAIGETTLTGGAAVLSNTGKLTLGTSNNVLVADAGDANYRLWVGHATAASAPFSVSKSGGVTASLGLIGGWAISNSTIQTENAVLSSTGKMTLGTIYGMAVIDPTHADWRLWIGNATDIATNPTVAQFRVSKQGFLTASGVNITGAISAESGSITGNFSVAAALSVGTNGSIYSGPASTWQSTGYQLQYNAGTPRMYIGDGGVTTGDKYLMWDGTNLSFRGTNTSLTTGGLFEASNVNVTGIINASSGTITGTLTMGAGGKITTTNADIDVDGFLVRTGGAWNSNEGYRLNSGTTTYAGLWSTFTNATDAEMRLEINKRPDVATYALDRNIYMIVGTTAPQAKTSKMWLISKTINVSGVQQKVAEVITVASSVGSTIDINAETVRINNQTAWHAGNFTPGNYSLATHNHAGVYALVSHTHSFTDISGNGNISTTGTLAVSSNVDSTHVLGRGKIGSPATDSMYLSHFDHLSTTNYALVQTSAGLTIVNAPTGQEVRAAVNNTTVAAFADTAVTFSRKIVATQEIYADKWIRIQEISTAPAAGDLTSGTQGALFVHGDRLIFKFKKADGTTRAFGIDLTTVLNDGDVISWKQINI